MICGAGRVAEQGGRTLRLLICGAGRVAEQGGRTLRLLICGAGRVAEQGGRTLRLLICGAGRVAEQGGRTLRLLICGAGRVAEQGGRTLRLLICGAGRVAEQGWGGDENYWFLVPDRWLKRALGGHQAIDLRYFKGQDGWQKRGARHQADGAWDVAPIGVKEKLCSLTIFFFKNSTIILTMLGAIPCSHLTCPGLLWKISEIMPADGCWSALIRADRRWSALIRAY